MTKRLLLVAAMLIGVGLVAFAITWQRVVTTPATSNHDGHQAQPEDESATPRADVALDTRRQQLIGVRTVRVERASVAPEIRAAGTIAYDETRQVEVNTRVDGWIRDLYADYTGRAVRRGDPLFTLYSPDLIAGQHEYLLALRGASAMPHDDTGSLTDYSDRLAAAARERLLRLEMTPTEVDQLARTGQPSETVTLRAPADGVV